MERHLPFGLKSDQDTLSLLFDAVTGALRDHEESPDMLRQILWRDIGIGGATISEEQGGTGGSAGETWVIMESLGRSPAWTPYLSSSVLGAGALKLGGGTMADALLPRISAGEVLTSLAYLEPSRRNAADPATTIAVPSPEGFAVNGTKVGVLGGGLADYMVFSAMVPDLGTTLFCIETSRPGLEAACYATLDGGEAADIDLRGVQVTSDHVIGSVGGGQPMLDRLIDEGTAALCAAACGTMRTMIEQTVAYCSQRQQFGKALVDFQVLRHRLVDMHIAAEQATSLSQLAFRKLDAPEAERQEAISGAKYLVAEACRVVSQGAVQLHGGIGTTEELAIGRFFKRALMFEHMFGGAADHLDRYRLAQPWAVNHNAREEEIAEAVCP